MKPHWHKYHLWFLLGWLFTIIICVTNSFLVIKYQLYGGESGGFAMVLPFLAMGVLLGAYGIYLWMGKRDIFSEYVKSNYPEIRRNVADTRIWTLGFFIRGKYDDGTDEKLNQIKLEAKKNRTLIIGTFSSIYIIEMFNLVLFVCYHR